MKALVCEMCGSHDVVKQNGLFVCQHCGTKYSVEEAKKMMIEGTVKIDTSDELRNLYEIARRAKEAKNNENAAKYYDMILIKDPSSWEANFFTVYFKAMTCKIGEIASAATSVNNCIHSTFVLIRNNVSDADERKKAVLEVREHAYSISKMLFEAAGNHFENIAPSIKANYRGEYLANVIAAGGIPGELCNSLVKVFVDDAEVFSDVGVDILKSRIAEGLSANIVSEYAAAIQKYDPSYQPPESKPIDLSASTATSNDGGCYVATAVYGSYDCPQVWTLRRFRDDTLASTWYGRLFIRTYYSVSPTLVRWFGHTEWFKKFWKERLDKMVNNLQANGVESTPYQDKEW